MWYSPVSTFTAPSVKSLLYPSANLGSFKKLVMNSTAGVSSRRLGPFRTDDFRPSGQSLQIYSVVRVVNVSERNSVAWTNSSGAKPVNAAE